MQILCWTLSVAEVYLTHTVLWKLSVLGYR